MKYAFISNDDTAAGNLEIGIGWFDVFYLPAHFVPVYTHSSKKRSKIWSGM